MARASYYANIQPSEFDQMDFEEAAKVTQIAMKIHMDEREHIENNRLEMTKGIMRASGAKLTS
jgi:hypothetical protein